MKLLRCQAQNFGSYKELDFDFSNQGLSLVFGSTGTGKSTLLDIPAWCLFGITAKNGNVDDVRSWFDPKAPTFGSVSVLVGDTEISVTRTRGAGCNDLFWQEGEAQEVKRGKDISETQKLLEARIGVSASLYVASSYFHEFSDTANFFINSAKQRREVFENIANLEFPAKLSKKAADKRKAIKAVAKEQEIEHSVTSGRLNQLEALSAQLNLDSGRWFQKHSQELTLVRMRLQGFEKEKESRIAALTTKLENFETQKSSKIDQLIQKIESLEEGAVNLEEVAADIAALRSKETCSECGQPVHKNQKKIEVLQEKIRKQENASIRVEAYKRELAQVVESQNPYERELELESNAKNSWYSELEALERQDNPYEDRLESLRGEKEELTKVFQAQKEKVEQSYYEINALSRLTDLASELRAALLERAVQRIQDKTNYYLETYFEGAFRIELSLTGSDSLDVGISKDGNPCVYRQLSKGQRGLLKLCFVVSVMEIAANNAGIHFDNLWFDEALDGLDADLKVKAFGLFQELEKKHSSIFVIEHSTEFKSLFSKRYEVTMRGDTSVIEECDEE